MRKNGDIYLFHTTVHDDLLSHKNNDVYHKFLHVDMTLMMNTPGLLFNRK